jgi:hypothetical protein
MSDIEKLDGIAPDEIVKLRQSGLATTEQFLARVDVNRAQSIEELAAETTLSAARLIELVPTMNVPVNTWPDEWIHDLTVRLLQQDRAEGSFNQFKSDFKKSWISWQTNLPILMLCAGLICLLVLGLRATGMLGALPHPLGLRDKVLIAARDLKSGSALRSSDLSEALLPPGDDYFKGADKLDGLVLARNLSGRKPLRHGDVLRPQVRANRDIPADAPIEKEALDLVWSPYQPGAALRLEDVSAHRSKQPLRKDAIILSEFIEP